jgi:hypothetical protein
MRLMGRVVLPVVGWIIIPVVALGFPVVALCLPPANGLSSLRDAVNLVGCC